MKLRGLVLIYVFSLPVACKDTSGAKPYDTYQDCFDDQTFKVKLDTNDAIITCCTDHPIGGKTKACLESKADCINFLTANLNQTSASTTEVSDACQSYIDMMSPGSGG
jgi:hypothetical protein